MAKSSTSDTYTFIHTNLNVDFVPGNCLQNLKLSSLNVQTETFCVIIDLVFIKEDVFSITLYLYFPSEIPEIIDCAISCGQDKAVEGKALHVVRL